MDTFRAPCNQAFSDIQTTKGALVMALPSSVSAYQARKSDANTQLPAQQNQPEPDTNLPRITTRISSTSNNALLATLLSASNRVETLSDECETTEPPPGNEDARPLQSGPVQYAEAKIGVASKAETLETMPLPMALAQLLMRNLPRQFSVPDPTRGYLIKFDCTLVSLENAAPSQLGYLLHYILDGCNNSNESMTYSCVQHLLNLGADVNANRHGASEWIAPLNMAVWRDSVALVSLLLKAGAHPNGYFRMNEAVIKGEIAIVRELLKAGADPWQSLGRPEQHLVDCEHVSVADFYAQTGMNINAEATETGYSDSKLSTLELAYGDRNPKALEQLLDAGIHVPDVIRLKYGYSEQEHYDYHGRATNDAIVIYRAQRAYVPCSFMPYTLLQDTLQPGATTAASTTSTTTVSVSTLAQAALKPSCNALIDELYAPAAVVRLIGCVNDMPPAFAQAVVQALSLARVLGHYSAGKGAKAGQLDQGIRVALVGTGLWEKYLDCKARFETLQSHIDRYQADGRTLLTTAASNGSISMIRVLVKLGARVNFPDKHGDYPLTAAAKARKPDTCSALLSLGGHAGTSDLQQRSTLFHVVDWLTHTDIIDLAAVERIASLIEQLFGLGYDLRQPTPDDHADHAAYPTVVDLLCKPENCVKLALLGQARTGTLVRTILSNIDRRGSLPFLN
jgi:ankyrin repeat protein